jgi:hypothetical protein
VIVEGAVDEAGGVGIVASVMDVSMVSSWMIDRL